MVNSALSQFIKLLADPQIKVVESCSKLLSKIAENSSDVFYRSLTIDNDLQLMLTALNSRPSISKHISWTFSYIIEDIDLFSDSVYA